MTQVAPDIAVASFAPACGGGTCIVQPNKQQLDSLGDRLMYRLAYRVFRDHASMVVNHSVTAGSSVGVRWYELRAPIGTTAFGLYQQGTFAPDSNYRWMGSAAMDGAGNIAIGYSKSSSSVYPSIAIASRTPAMPLGTMGTESILQAGAGAQTTYNRWGDYTSLRIDPSDDTTFWYTNEYYSRNSVLFNYNWSTAIASFTAGGVDQHAGFQHLGGALAHRQSRLKQVHAGDGCRSQWFELGEFERQRLAAKDQRQLQPEPGNQRRRDLDTHDQRQPQCAHRHL